MISTVLSAQFSVIKNRFKKVKKSLILGKLHLPRFLGQKWELEGAELGGFYVSLFVLRTYGRIRFVEYSRKTIVIL